MPWGQALERFFFLHISKWAWVHSWEGSVSRAVGRIIWGYLLGFAVSGIGALRATRLRSPCAPWRSQRSQHSLAVEGI